MKSADSGPQALPRGDVVHQLPAWPLGHKNLHLSPKTTSAHRIRSVDDEVTEPLRAAEVAQARLFEGTLRAEIAHLEQRARSMTRRWMVQRQRRIGDGRPPEELVQLRAQIEEAYCLLETLRRRFLPAREWGRRHNGPNAPRF
jgi:hypothetical protein